MITRIEALGYRCLRYVSQPLGPFHVLVGPNASGKTTFLDVIAFLGRLVSDGPDVAIEERTQNFYDLLWRGEGTQFELAIEAQIPVALKKILPEIENKNEDKTSADFDVVRYEVVFSIDPKTQLRGLKYEQVLLTREDHSEVRPRRQFPELAQPPTAILMPRDSPASPIVEKREGFDRADRFWWETNKGLSSFRLGPRRSALGNLPPDEEVSCQHLAEGVTYRWHPENSSEQPPYPQGECARPGTWLQAGWLQSPLGCGRSEAELSRPLPAVDRPSQDCIS